MLAAGLTTMDGSAGAVTAAVTDTHPDHIAGQKRSRTPPAFAPCTEYDEEQALPSALGPRSSSRLPASCATEQTAPEAVAATGASDLCRRNPAAPSEAPTWLRFAGRTWPVLPLAAVVRDPFAWAKMGVPRDGPSCCERHAKNQPRFYMEEGDD
jgi:hypothetical protein